MQEFVFAAEARRAGSAAALLWVFAAAVASGQAAPPAPPSDRDPAPEAIQAGQAPPAAAPAAPDSGPKPIGLSGQLVDWLQIRGEFRGRLEGFTGGGFRSNNDDGYMLDRFRVNATIAPGALVKFVVQAQDARAFDKTTGGQANPFRDTLDLRLAYGEFGGPRNMVRIGRQELAFGEQRLIGHLNWANNARSFDGVRATIARKPFTFDLFAASVVSIRPEAFDKSGHGNALFGFYGSSAKLPGAAIEPYLFYRQSTNLAVETGGLADLRQLTVGARVTGKIPRQFDYGMEIATQTGAVGSDDVRAWAGHWVFGRTFAQRRTKPRTFIEFNRASGDRHSSDGRRGTFDQLYPTGHDKLGLADQVGWQNIDHLRGGLELKFTPQLSLAASYHSFWLASPADALYSASGAAVARSAAGAAGRHVGQELDLQAAYSYSPQLQIGTGFASLRPGAFLDKTTPGASYGLAYLMVTYVFIGDRPRTPASLRTP
jgi:hypothetical protein